MKMKRLLVSYIGKNHSFRKWLREQRPSNVVSLDEYRRNRLRGKSANIAVLPEAN